MVMISEFMTKNLNFGHYAASEGNALYNSIIFLFYLVG